MKFSKFVEKKDSRVKKHPNIGQNFDDFLEEEGITIDTPIGKTDKKFFETVAREKRYILETSVGFGLSKMELKRVFDYIKSWLIRYDIPYEAVNPYLTVGTVHGNYKRNDFINELKTIRDAEEFEPEGVFILREDDKDYIILDYEYNKSFVDKFDKVLSEHELQKQENLCFVKLFSIPIGSFDLNIFDSMIYNLPEVPKVIGGNVGLLVRRI
jgi:hypothetical protein